MKLPKKCDFNELKVVAIEQFLKIHGWSIESEQNIATVWTKEDYMVLVPKRDNIGDYLYRIADIISTLVESENEYAGDIIREIKKI